MARRNILLYENPDYLGMNPRRRRRRHRNPGLALPRIGGYLHGVDAQDVVAAGAGFFVSGWLPGQVVKPAVVGGTLTQNQKIFRILLAAVGALGAGFVAKNLSPSAAKAAVLGGLTGAALSAVNAFRPGTFAISQTNTVTPRVLSSVRVGESVTISPSTHRSEETINLIQP